ETGARPAGVDALPAPPAAAGPRSPVLLAEPLARAEQGALHGPAGHAETLADVGVAAPLELAQHEDLVVRLGEAAERARQVLELLLGAPLLRRTAAHGDEPADVGGC